MVNESLARLTTFIKAWDMVGAKIHDAPETLSDYIANFFKIVSLLEKGDAYSSDQTHPIHLIRLQDQGVESVARCAAAAVAAQFARRSI